MSTPKTLGKKSSGKKKVSSRRTVVQSKNGKVLWSKEFNYFFIIVGIILCISMISAFLASVSSADYSSGLESFKQKLEIIKDYFGALGIKLTTSIQSVEDTPMRETPTSTFLDRSPRMLFKEVTIKINNVSTPSWQDGNIPQNMVDGNAVTRWSFEGNSSIIIDLGTKKFIDAMNITWYLGNQRQYDFEVTLSNESTKNLLAFKGSSQMATEKYEFKDKSDDYLNITAQFVNLRVTGNNVNDWSSINEITLIDVTTSKTSDSNDKLGDSQKSKEANSNNLLSDSPSFKPYIPLWGLVGSSSYVFVTTAKYMKKGDLQRRYIPEQISRLILGPAIAVVVFYIVSTGSFFGLSFDFTKIPTIVSPTYVYAAISFFVGYTTRGAIKTFSSVIHAIFKIDDEEEEPEPSKTKK